MVTRMSDHLRSHCDRSSLRDEKYETINTMSRLLSQLYRNTRSPQCLRLP